MRHPSTGDVQRKSVSSRGAALLAVPMILLLALPVAAILVCWSLPANRPPVQRRGGIADHGPVQDEGPGWGRDGSSQPGDLRTPSHGTRVPKTGNKDRGVEGPGQRVRRAQKGWIPTQRLPKWQSQRVLNQASDLVSPAQPLSACPARPLAGRRSHPEAPSSLRGCPRGQGRFWGLRSEI
jgi:hypothetical protein